MNQGLSDARPWPIQIMVNAKVRHRALLTLTVAASLAVTVILAAYGWNYYWLDQTQRPLVNAHGALKPSGTIGLRLGMLGGFIFALVYLYPLRKRWMWLSRQGNSKHWLNFHIVLGLVAPVIITYHSAFKVQGFAGMAYWTLLALAGSGLIGRYFYAQIPRTRDAAAMTLKQMQELSRQLLDESTAQRFAHHADVASLFHLPDVQDVQRMSLCKALYRMIAWDLARPVRIWRLRRRMKIAFGRGRMLDGILPAGHQELEKVVALISRQASLSKKILFLSKTERVFFLWHVIHRPFSLTFAIFVLVHIGVVVSLGYF